MRPFATLLLLFIGLSDAAVEFSNSALYDIYDFVKIDEIAIPICNKGCHMYMSTSGEFPQYEDGLDPYATNIFIVDNVAHKQYNFAASANVKDGDNHKVPLEFPNGSKISIVNNNTEDNMPFDIALYVVDLATATASADYEIYDFNYVIGNNGFVKSKKTVTVMSTTPFAITAEPSDQKNSVTARLVGFDNALDSNSDGCIYTVKQPDTNPRFLGINIFFPGPIGSIVFDRPGSMSLGIALAFGGLFDMVSEGCMVSGGYSGCSLAGFGPPQTFRFINSYMVPNNFILNGNEGDYTVMMDVRPNLAGDHKITIKDNFNPLVTQTANGTTTQLFSFFHTSNMFISYSPLTGPEGFIIRYSTALTAKHTTTTQTTTNSSSTTEFMTSPTTSGVGQLTGTFLLPLLLPFTISQLL